LFVLGFKGPTRYDFVGKRKKESGVEGENQKNGSFIRMGPTSQKIWIYKVALTENVRTVVDFRARKYETDGIAHKPTSRFHRAGFGMW
jgi:hypothetical protein